MLNLQTFPIGLNLQWRAPETFGDLNGHLRDWLLDESSLTEKLQALTSDFSVELLGQDERPLHANEYDFLDDTNTSYQVREVLLKSTDIHWIFARSVLPQALCDEQLAGLGNKPLGQRIFNDPEFVRSDFQLAEIPSEFLRGYLPANANELGSTFYARRSLFQYNEHRLIVAEAFLPPHPCYQDIEK